MNLSAPMSPTTRETERVTDRGSYQQSNSIGLYAALQAPVGRGDVCEGSVSSILRPPLPSTGAESDQDQWWSFAPDLRDG